MKMMKKNTLEILFKEFNKEKVKYCVRSKYKHLPKKLEGGDIDILIEKKNWQKANKIIRKLGFRFYPFTQPNLFYFYYDKELGLILLDILLTKTLVPIKKFKKFFIPLDEKPIPNKKGLLKRIYTGLIRRFYYMFRGRVIVFEGVDGSGKSTNVQALYDSLEILPIKKQIVHFATHFKKRKPSSLKRLFTRSYCILKVYKNIILGRIVITDRYIYLTFRKHHKILKSILRSFAPTPDIVFVTKAPIKTIKKRKKGQRDLLDEKMIRELNNIYENIPNSIIIDTQKPIKENLGITVNKLLEKILR